MAGAEHLAIAGETRTHSFAVLPRRQARRVLQGAPSRPCGGLSKDMTMLGRTMNRPDIRCRSSSLCLARRWAAVGAASLLVVLIPGSARADDEPPIRPPASAPAATDADVARVEGLVHAAAAEAHKARHAGMLAGLVAGAALVPTGIVLNHRSDDVAQSIGVGLIVGGAAPAAFSLLLLLPSPAEQFADSYDRRRASGMSGRDLVRATEADWQRLAENSRDRRVRMGHVEMWLGAAATGAGIYLLVSKPFSGMSRNEQYTIGSLLVGPGIPFVTLGIRSLVQESPEERAWATYHAIGGRDAATDRSASFVPSVALSPLRGGLYASLSLSR
jgi:hypothetical protein